MIARRQENISLQSNLSSSQMELKAQFQKATEELRQRDQTIDSLRSELSALKNHLGEISSSDIKKQLQDAEDNMKRRDEELVSLKQLLHTQQKEMEELRAALQDSKTSQGSHTSEESCKQEIRHLMELLAGKEQHISRVERKRQRRTAAYVDTLHLLTRTQAALQQQEEKCAAVESELRKKADQQQSLQQELQSKEGSIVEELSQPRSVPDRARQRWSRPAAGELPQRSLHIFLSPFRRCQSVRGLNLKQAVFLFTAAEQWEEQNQEGNF